MDELKKVVPVELDDDDLDMVAGGCGNGNGNNVNQSHKNNNGKGHSEHGNGWGKGHDGCGGSDGTATTELEDGADTYAAPATTPWTCPCCSNVFQVTSNSDCVAHLQQCPKNPNACI